MPRILILFLLLTSILQIHCGSDKTPKENDTKDVLTPIDSILKKELPLNTALIKNVEYTYMVNKLKFTIQVGQRTDSLLALKFNFYHPLSFEEHLKYQGILLNRVFEDFKDVNVNSAFLGRLMYTGDLSIKASLPDLDNQWDGKSYPELKNILDTGYIVEAYKPFFDQYGVQLKGVTFEKAFMIDTYHMLEYSKVTVPEDSLPTRCLDAMLWLDLE